MKRAVILFVVITLMFTLISCTTANRNPKNPPGTTQQPTTQGPGTTQQPTTAQGNKTAYKDGTYTGAGDKWQYGSEDATVVINNGQIKSVNLRRLDTEGKEVNYEEWKGEEKDGKVYPNLKQFRTEMADKMIERQTYEVDAISGATVSCENWKLAVKRALEKAK